MDGLDQNILNEFAKIMQEGVSPAQIMRQVFLKFGEISPPVSAQYFKALYAIPSIDFMPALGAWWHDKSSDISDDEFDRRIRAIVTFGR